MKLPKVLLAIFAMHISLVRSNFLQQRYQISSKRPSWATSISIPGQTIEADFRIAQFGGNPQNIPSVWHKNSRIFTLNHVLAWSQIYTKFGFLMQDWAKTPNQQTETAVRLFIRKVFQIDNQANVNPAFCSGYQNAGWNHQCIAVSHAGNQRFLTFAAGSAQTHSKHRSMRGWKGMNTPCLPFCDCELDF